MNMPQKLILLFVSVVLAIGLFFVIKRVVFKEEPVVITEDVVGLPGSPGVEKPMKKRRPATPEDSSMVADEHKDAALCSNNFSFALYAELKGQPGNIFFSPYNISNALSIASAGARGETEQQMKIVLCETLSPELFFSASAALAHTFEQQDKKLYELNIANRLFMQDGFGLLPAFGEVVTKQYKEPFEFVDFAKASQASNTINAWVAKKTRKKIKTIVEASMFSADTRLAIVSAIYFKGKWIQQFDKAETKKKPFYLDKGHKVDVDMMHQKETFNYMEDDALQMLELPYDGDRLSMAIILPREKDGLKMVEGKMNSKMLSDCFAQANEEEVIVDLPRFKMETTYNLKPILSQIGMPVAFSGDADFSGINGAKDLYISDVVHKAFVQTDEEGSEAAAATAVIIATKSALQPKTYSFVADHPFVFFIRDMQTGLILFAGRVTKP